MAENTENMSSQYLAEAVSDLWKNLESIALEIQKLKSEKQITEEKCNDLHDKLQQIPLLESKINTLEQENLALERKNQLLKEKTAFITSLSKEITELKEYNRKLNEELFEKSEKLNYLSKVADDFELAKKDLLRKNHELNRRHEENERTKEKLAENENKLYSLKKYEKLYFEAVAALEEANLTEGNLIQENNKLQIEISDLQSTQEMLEIESKSGEVQITAMRKRISELEEVVSKGDDLYNTINKYKSLAEINQIQNKELENRIKDLNYQINRLKNEETLNNLTIDKLRNEKIELEKLILTRYQQIRLLEDQLNSRESKPLDENVITEKINLIIQEIDGLIEK